MSLVRTSQHIAFAAICVTAATMLYPATVQGAADPTSDAFATHFVETVANGAFVKAGYKVVHSATHTVTSRGITPSGQVVVNAAYSFDVDQLSFTGSGSYSFGESSGVQTIGAALSLASSDGSRVLDFDYTSVNDLAGLVLEEDLAISQGGAVPASVVIDKTSHLALQGPTETETISATFTVDGASDQVWVSETTQDLGGGQFQRQSVYQSSGASGSYYLETDYSMGFDAAEQMTATFTRYDLTVDGVLRTLDPDAPSYLTTTRVDAATYDLDYRLRLVESGTGDKSSVTASGVITLSPVERAVSASFGGPISAAPAPPVLGPLAAGGDGWSWSEFGKSTVTGGAGGAVGGAVAGSIATDSAAPIGAGAGAAIGAVAGAAAGATAYTVGKAWDWIFGSDDDVEEEPQEPKQPKEVEDQIASGGLEAQPIPRQLSFSSGTFFGGHSGFGSCDYDATSVATP